MREIKFRGKSLDNGEWVVGSYQADIMLLGQHTIIYSDMEGFYCEDEVIPETVGQYTGLKDRKGVEIFDGDIVQHGYFNTYSREKLTAKYTVTWGRCGFGTVLVCITEQEFCEVIGNIHDNPELLEVQE